MKDKIYERIDLLRNREAEIDGEVLRLFNAFCDSVYKGNDSFLETLFSFLDPKATSFEELYSGTFSSFIHFLLDDEYASVFFSYLRLEETNTCGRFPVIMPSRSGRPVLHLPYLEIAITNFFHLNAYQWSEQQLFADESSIEDLGWMIIEWMAGRINQGGKEITDSLLNSLSDGSWVDDWHPCFLWAITLSGNQDLIDQLCKVLDQDAYHGYCEDVVMALCDGQPNSMLTLLHFALDSYLQNGDWMLNGIYDDFVINEIKHKFGLDHLPIEEEYNAFTLLINCLESEEQRNEALSSDIFLNIYIGLATMSFYDSELVWQKANQFNNEGKDLHIKAALLYFSHTWRKQAFHLLSTRVMEKWSDNLSVLAYALPGFMCQIDMTRHWKKIVDYDLSEFLCTEDELRKQYYFFKGLLSNLSKRLIFQENTAYWEYKKLTRSMVIAKMAGIAWLLDDKKLKDDVIDYIDQSECTGVFIRLCLTKPQGKKQLRFLIQSLGSRREDARCWAYSIVKDLKMCSKEIELVKQLQKSRYKKTRQMAKSIVSSRE